MLLILSLFMAAVLYFDYLDYTVVVAKLPLESIL